MAFNPDQRQLQILETVPIDIWPSVEMDLHMPHASGWDVPADSAGERPFMSAEETETIRQRIAERFDCIGSNPVVLDVAKGDGLRVAEAGLLRIVLDREVMSHRSPHHKQGLHPQNPDVFQTFVQEMNKKPIVTDLGAYSEDGTRSLHRSVLYAAPDGDRLVAIAGSQIHRHAASLAVTRVLTFQPEELQVNVPRVGAYKGRGNASVRTRMANIALVVPRLYTPSA